MQYNKICTMCLNDSIKLSYTEYYCKQERTHLDTTQMPPLEKMTAV